IFGSFVSQVLGYIQKLAQADIDTRLLISIVACGRGDVGVPEKLRRRVDTLLGGNIRIKSIASFAFLFQTRYSVGIPLRGVRQQTLVDAGLKLPWKCAYLPMKPRPMLTSDQNVAAFFPAEHASLSITYEDR